MTTRAKKWIRQVEETSGQKLEPEIVQAIIWVDKAAIAFKIIGERDKAEGKKPYSTEEFVAWGHERVPDDSDMAWDLAELMQLCYMDGYESGAA